MLNRRQSQSDCVLPHRNPFVGPPRPERQGWWQPPPADVIELFVVAVNRWNYQTDHDEPSRCRSLESPGIGRTNREA